MRLPALLVATTLALASTPVRGDAKKSPPAYERFGKVFVVAKFTGDVKALDRMYADEVLLLPGHEYLKKTYGINPSGDRSKAKSLAKKKMIELDLRLAGRLDEEKRKKLTDVLNKCTYTFAVAKGGSTKMDPSDPLGTEDGKLTLSTRKGDVVMKVQPKPKGDFLLYVLRQEKDLWKVVADYTD
jgi:hypothetical protein